MKGAADCKVIGGLKSADRDTSGGGVWYDHENKGAESGNKVESQIRNSRCHMIEGIGRKGKGKNHMILKTKSRKAGNGVCWHWAGRSQWGCDWWNVGLKCEVEVKVVKCDCDCEQL